MASFDAAWEQDKHQEPAYGLERSDSLFSGSFFAGYPSEDDQRSAVAFPPASSSSSSGGRRNDFNPIEDSFAHDSAASVRSEAELESLLSGLFEEDEDVLDGASSEASSWMEGEDLDDVSSYSPVPAEAPGSPHSGASFNGEDSGAHASHRELATVPEVAMLASEMYQTDVPSSSSSSSASVGGDVGTGGAGSSSIKIYYRRCWSPEEDAKLTELIGRLGTTSWSTIALELPGKTGNQCSQRWQKALDPRIVKGKWTPAEDMALKAAVEKLGFKWKQISRLVPGRTGKQCRDRYTSRLNPKLKLGNWTKREEMIALKAHKQFGNKWAAIQKLLPNRSWYTIKWRIECLKKEEELQRDSLKAEPPTA